MSTRSRPGKAAGLLLAAMTAGAVTPAKSGEIKPYIWSFAKPSNSKYEMTVGARLPVLGQPEFGSDVTLPSALPRDSLNAPRSYVPSGTLWSKLRFSDNRKLFGLDDTGLTMRYDPQTDAATSELSAGKTFSLTGLLDFTLRDSYALSADRFEPETLSWNTKKAIELSVKSTKTKFTAAFNASLDDAAWHSSLSMEQPVSQTFRLQASVEDLQAETPTSVFRARFSRAW
ncbi:hypothetical protein [Roseibium aggregatum]|uniref:Uncharacterized protein n=1 Tax=Roseibium aggregatum TaxID=187304 RepID=A0A939J1F5_9HYPH|nr:hypothetical protein [Roseibium aggregatum]MBN9672086.1 hypothetical protein [Roseibium aggregatum]